MQHYDGFGGIFRFDKSMGRSICLEVHGIFGKALDIDIGNLCEIDCLACSLSECKGAV